jgi:hypothetical protein
MEMPLEVAGQSIPPWVSGHPNVKNATSVMGEYQEDVQDLKADGGDREEVD